MKHIKIIFIFFLCLILVCLSLEGAQRLSVYYHYWRDVKKFNSPLLKMVSPIDRREYVLKKNVTYDESNGIKYQTNEKGLRGEGVPYESKENTYRVLMLGDSYLFGWGLKEENTLPIKLEKLLNKNPLQDNTGYEIINGGIYGYNTVQELEFFRKEGYKYKPNLVILYFVMNDMEPQWSAPRHPKYEYEYCESWFFDHIIRRVNEWYARKTGDKSPKFTVYRNRHNTEYLRALDNETYKWQSCSQAIRDLAKELKRRNIDFYVFIMPSIEEDFGKYSFCRIHSKIKDLCKDNGIKVMDLLDFFIDKDAKVFQISKDDAHPNSKANDLIAEEIYKYLVNNG